jgi:hypothetical protein
MTSKDTRHPSCTVLNSSSFAGQSARGIVTVRMVDLPFQVLLNPFAMLSPGVRELCWRISDALCSSTLASFVLHH